MALVAQPHGGALRVGNPGNAGGPGKPPSALRQMLRQGYEEMIPRVQSIARGETVLTITSQCPKCGYEPPGERQEIAKVFVDAETSLRAIDHMAKIGLGVAKGVDVEEIKGKLGRTIDLVESECEPAVAARLLKSLEAIWDE